ncbi:MULTISPECIES: OmpP1/FadL family transporter [unclassified Ruegeria]|uniref:OmpP1/FadL family transporter n=1 Tax=unclassified Ruegeria TaxID=2625375 RepID=UPI00148912A8|nr:MULTISPECIES: outer membrane beta-barrel protein [unclassified Ruegeria]
MRKALFSACAVCVGATTAQAGGLDRSGQPITLIFEEGNYAEFSVSRTNPDVEGTDLTNQNPFGTPTGNVAQDFNQVGAGVKYQFNDQFSAALIYDQPFGSDISYPTPSGNPTQPGSLLLGGTEAFAESDSYTALLRYKFDPNWSVHGGVRYQQVEGNIQLQGLAYGPFSGYGIDLDREGGFGWVLGAAYEIPDIALRVALTYQSKISFDFDTTESSPLFPVTLTGTQEVETPQSVNLDFQTGVAQDTLLFGSVRWADHSQTQLSTTAVGPLPSVELIDLNNSFTFNLGLAHRFNENWAASVNLGYEEADDDDLVSPLAPTNGFRSIGVGLQYTHENMRISGGLRYTDLGDAFAETGTPDVARADFSGNDAVSFGIRVGFSF